MVFTVTPASDEETVVWCTPTPVSLGFNGVLGGLMLMLGLLLAYSTFSRRRNAHRLLAADTKVADAKVHDLHITHTQEESTYFCSYEFSAARADGVACRVEVTNREVPEAAFDQLAKMGEGPFAEREPVLLPVHYLPEDPSSCKLTSVAEVESSNWDVYGIVLAITLVAAGLFMIIAIQCGLFPYGIPFYVLGMVMAYGAVCCYCAYKGPDVKLTELDQSEPIMAVSAKTPPYGTQQSH